MTLIMNMDFPKWDFLEFAMWWNALTDPAIHLTDWCFEKDS